MKPLRPALWPLAQKCCRVLSCARGGLPWALLALLWAGAGSDSAQAVQVLTQLATPLNESAVDDLNGVVGVLSAPLHPTSFGGAYNAAAFTDGNPPTAPSENVFWWPDGQAYSITWDLGTTLPAAARQLDTVSINIDSHDPGRHGFFGSLSISTDGVTFTEIPGTRYKDPLAQAGTGFAPLFNNVTYCFAPGEVTGFRYLRLNSFDDTSINLLQPRYVEVDAYTSRVPGPSSRPTFWSIRNGRFYVDDQWVFLKTGKLLRYFGGATDASPFLSDIDVMIDQLHYNHVSLNIYPDQFDTQGIGRVEPARQPGVEVIKQLIDHCWQRGIFVSLSFETGNTGGGGVPANLFTLYPDMVALNALGQTATDVEYGGANGKFIPSIHHPRYLKWSHDFIRNFLLALGDERASQLLYVETTVEPQYLGINNVDADQRRAALDYSEAARLDFQAWYNALPAGDPRRAFTWPTTQTQRDSSIGNSSFNQFRAQALGQWVTSDIQAIHSVVPDVYVAVDYNNRFDDPQHLRVGDPDTFLTAIQGAQVIQVAPHAPAWTSLSWDDVHRVNDAQQKHWAISEHMTANGGFPADDSQMTSILTNTLARGTRWGWEFVNVENNFPANIFDLYQSDWSSVVLDVIEGANWAPWLARIGATDFTPQPRRLTAYYSTWRQKYFSWAPDDSISGPYADPGHYGIPNLLRYALGNYSLVPRADMASIHPAGWTNGYYTVGYTYNRMARDIQLQPEYSDDLKAWHALPATNVLSQIPQNECAAVIVRDSLPATRPARYFRLHVLLTGN